MPIVFKVVREKEDNKAYYTLYTKDSRVGTNRPSPRVSADRLVRLMYEVTELFEAQGRSVVFEYVLDKEQII